LPGNGLGLHHHATQRPPEYLSKEELDGAQCLVLRRTPHPPLGYEIGDELLNLLLAQVGNFKRVR
jgi:hypothetical protein